MDSRAVIARALAAAFLAGGRKNSALVDRSGRVLGRRWRWIGPLVRRFAKSFAAEARPRKIIVARFILADGGFRRAYVRHRLTVANPLADGAAMRPIHAAHSWRVPSICTAAELARRLDVSIGELDWFADMRSLENKQTLSRLGHYHYRLLSKPFGQIRVIEAPKPRLKLIQRRILTEILDRIPPHACVHGFRRGGSIKTFAAPHVGKRVVLKIDLQDFFPSISVARIQALFRTIGYPEHVADLLAGLCTNSTPTDVWDPVEPPDIRRAIEMDGCIRGRTFLKALPLLRR